ncbi:hypothetical protein K2X30_12895 [bacterium]|jgi:folate-binding protein YgfZ|nr:hypothetical protein [bacterium]
MQDPIHYFEPNQALSWRQARLEGPDARDFLNRITSVDVKNLAVAQGTPACILDAQGRFRAYFWLWCLGQNEFLFEMEGGPEDRLFKEFLGVIDQFTFAEKMKLTTPTPRGLWVFGSPAEPLNHGSRDYGRPWTTLWDAPAPASDWVRADLDLLESWRIAALRPRPGFEIDAQSNPLELGLIDAVADQKGCYPGQEIIEKIVAIGAPARRLVQLQLSGPAQAGTELADGAGKLTSVSLKTGLALALVRKTQAQEGKQLQILGTTTSGTVLKVAPYAKS